MYHKYRNPEPVPLAEEEVRLTGFFVDLQTEEHEINAKELRLNPNFRLTFTLSYLFNCLSFSL